VEETLAVLLTVFVGAALPVATGVPLRCEPDTRGEPEARSVKDCVMVGEEVVDTDREKVLPAEALLENVSDCETDALPVTESVCVLAWEGDAPSEGDADAEAQARVDDDALLEGSWEKVAVMHTLTETQPEGVEEGDAVRVTSGERVAVGEKVPRAVPVATSEADKPGENDRDGEPEWLCDWDGDPVTQVVAETLRLPEPEKLGEGESEGDTEAERSMERVAASEMVLLTDSESAGEKVGHALAVRERGAEAVNVAVARGEADEEGGKVAVEQGVEEKEGVPELEGEAEGLPDSLTVIVKDTEAHPVPDSETTFVADGVREVEGEPDAVAPGDAETQLVADTVGDADVDRVPTGDRVDEDVTLTVPIEEIVIVGLSVPVSETAVVGVAACDTDVEPPALGVAESRTVAVPTAETVGKPPVDEGHIVLEGDAEGDTVRVPLAFSVAEASGEKLISGVGDLAGEPVSKKLVGEAVEEAVPGAVDVGEDVTEEVADGEGREDPLPDGDTVPQPLAVEHGEGDAVA